MAETCVQCTQVAPGESRWKGVALFVGALAFCPCHLPLTITLFAAVGATAWLAGQPALLYGAFGIVYVLILVFGVRYLMRRRDEDRAREKLHAQHFSSKPSRAA